MKVKLLAMDVDGTLTDGRIYMGSDGEAMKAFYAKDGYGIRRFLEQGGIPVVITGRSSEIVDNRCAELGITEVHQGVEDKLHCMQEVMKKYDLEQNEIAYIGDDLNDLECIDFAGLSACPSDAVEEIRERVDYICKQKGGRGAVREIIDRLLEE